MTDDEGRALWAPLRTPAFRMLWVAQLTSNVGTWMQTTGSQWFLVSASGSALVVAAVQTAATLPILLLALPAGALADLVDRRRLLMVTQAGMAVVAGALAAATFAHVLTPTWLLAATFCLGVGVAMNGPAWQAVQPDVLPVNMVATGATLSGASINAARALGPALGGVVVATAGAGWTFAVNAASFLVVLFAVRRWRPMVSWTPQRERMSSAMRTGVAYALHAAPIRRLLVRTALWMTPSSVIFALLPVVAHTELGLGAAGYGLLLGAVGCGAFAGALFLAPLRHRVSANRLVGWATVVNSAVLLGVGTVRIVAVVLVFLLIGGACWITALSTLNASAQISLPRWVRARGIGVYVLVQQGGQALGSVVWGVVAERTSGPTALEAAAGCLILTAAVARFARLEQPSLAEQGPPIAWLVPTFSDRIPDDAGPVRVVVEYAVGHLKAPDARGLFATLRPLRLRGGARRWSLTVDDDDPSTVRESYEFGSVRDAVQYNEIRLSAADHAVLTSLVDRTSAPHVTFEVAKKDGRERADRTRNGRARRNSVE